MEDRLSISSLLADQWRAETARLARWDEYLMGFARHAATNSKDSTKVGAALVSSDNSVLLCAYNGPPRGVEDLPKRRERPTKYLYAAHAEANLVAFAARRGIRTEGHKVYVTHEPCDACARALIQAGVTEIVCDGSTTSMPKEQMEAARTMFEEASVAYRTHTQKDQDQDHAEL